MNTIAIVGASLAGLRTAEQLRSQGFTGNLVLIGDEAHRPYDRPPLSKSFAAARATPEDLDLSAPGPEIPDTELRLGSAAARLDAANSEVVLADGSAVAYDGLVIATGTTPFVPDGLDLTLAGVHLLRTLDDAIALRDDLARRPARVAVLGAGFIGAELASTCRTLGLEVTLIDVAELPLERPLGREVAQHLLERHQASGTRFRLGVSATMLGSRDGRVTHVDLSDGSRVDADVVVVAVGVRPATWWLEDSGVELSNGVLCDPDLSVKGVDRAVAVGDVCRWTHPAFNVSLRLEHWSNAVEGAVVAAGTLLGRPTPHVAVPSFWSDQLGVKIQGIGLTSFADHVDVTVDPNDDLFAVYHRDGAPVGAVAFGKPRRLMPIRRELSAPVAAAG